MRPFEVDKDDALYLYFYSAKPFVAWALVHPYASLPVTGLFARYVREPVTLFVSAMVALNAVELNADWLPRLFLSFKEFLSAVSGNELIVLCSTPEELALIESHGFQALDVCQNTFANEDVFHVKTGAVKRYDAVYNSQYIPLKRHFLAQQVPSLALIYGIWGENREERYAQMKADCPGAALLNGAMDSVNGQPPDYRRLTPEEVNDGLNQARCGLCLSDVEGQMYASIEYLLAGLPVISTPNYGGREKLFPPEYSIICMPEPAHVAIAVRNMIRRSIDPHEVRAATLDLIRPHRQRFDRRLRERAGNAGCDMALIDQRLNFQRRRLSHGFCSGQTGQFLQELSAGGGPIYF